MQCHSAVTLERIIQYNPPEHGYSILTRVIDLSDFVWPHTHHVPTGVYQADIIKGSAGSDPI